MRNILLQLLSIRYFKHQKFRPFEEGIDFDMCVSFGFITSQRIDSSALNCNSQFSPEEQRVPENVWFFPEGSTEFSLAE